MWNKQQMCSEGSHVDKVYRTVFTCKNCTCVGSDCGFYNVHSWKHRFCAEDSVNTMKFKWTKALVGFRPRVQWVGPKCFCYWDCWRWRKWVVGNLQCHPNNSGEKRDCSFSAHHEPLARKLIGDLLTFCSNVSALTAHSEQPVMKIAT